MPGKRFHNPSDAKTPDITCRGSLVFVEDPSRAVVVAQADPWGSARRHSPEVPYSTACGEMITDELSARRSESIHRSR